MDDLERKLRALDEIPARDRWSEVAAAGEDTALGPTAPEPPLLRRVLTIAVAVSLVAASGVLLVDRLATDEARAPGNEQPPAVTGPALDADTLTITCTKDGASASASSVRTASDGVHLRIEGADEYAFVFFRGERKGDTHGIQVGDQPRAAAVLPMQPGPWEAACVSLQENEPFSTGEIPETAFTAAFQVVDPDGVWPNVQDLQTCGEPLVDPVPTAGVEAPLAGPVAGELLVNVWNPAGGGAGLTVNADGTEVREIAAGPGHPSAEAWSPDGSRVALTIADDDGNDQVTYAELEDSEIYVANADGSDPVRLTDNTASDDLVEWSPDGSTLSFRSNRERVLTLYAMNVDGSGVRRLVDLGGEDQSADSHDWSPDGSRIAFVGSTGRSDDPHCSDDHELYVMDADGSGLVQLTDDEWYEQDPVWSPDGSQIAFIASQQSDYAWDVFVIDADGSDLRRLTAYPGYDSAPVWSPDGTMLLFTSDRGRGGGGEEQAGDLYVMNADGSGVRPLFPTSALGYPGASGVWVEEWRP